jgi:hypothetical protein
LADLAHKVLAERHQDFPESLAVARRAQVAGRMRSVRVAMQATRSACLLPKIV